jgi:TPP-dependent indolepyruvate ferredoxin oxidoreductase alpha subunit
MASAAKIAVLPPPSEDRLSSAELVSRFSDAEIFSASQETTRIYNGKVLAKAVIIVQTRTHYSSLRELAKHMGVSKSVIYRQARGLPLSDQMFHRAIRDLALLLEEEGQRL